MLKVVCTNDPKTVEQNITMYEQWLQGKKYKSVGLDLVYTRHSFYQ